ncbi:MAG: hypothetical protein GWP18_00525 [Proteobacteria bacterium]|nr:hypothetical protein [Pseudomonadota bacterium]
MRWIPAIGGMIATMAAIIVLGSVNAATPADAAFDEEPEVEVVVVTTTTLPVIEEIVQLPQPDLDLAELDVDLSDVLADKGYSQFMGESELAETVGADIAQVLIDQGAVLVIPSEESTDGK